LENLWEKTSKKLSMFQNVANLHSLSSGVGSVRSSPNKNGLVEMEAIMTNMRKRRQYTVRLEKRPSLVSGLPQSIEWVCRRRGFDGPSDAVPNRESYLLEDLDTFKVLKVKNHPKIDDASSPPDRHTETVRSLEYESPVADIPPNAIKEYRQLSECEAYQQAISVLHLRTKITTRRDSVSHDFDYSRVEDRAIEMLDLPPEQQCDEFLQILRILEADEETIAKMLNRFNREQSRDAERKNDGTKETKQ
jgi:hypothetical protein